MGAALLGGLLNAGVVAARDAVVVELDDRRRTELAERFGVDVAAEVPPCRSVVVAVKPHHVDATVGASVGQGVDRVLSIAAGITTRSIEEAAHRAAGRTIRVVRAMPNTPALVGAGVSAICAGEHATSDDLDWAERLLSAVGLVVRVDEPQIDAVTGLTGSGPAYVFRFAECLIDAGRDVGLPEDLLEPMVTQLLVGSAALLADRGDPAALRVAVTSPGGTTERGLAALDDGAFCETLAAAVTLATERSRELGTQS